MHNTTKPKITLDSLTAFRNNKNLLWIRGQIKASEQFKLHIKIIIKGVIIIRNSFDLFDVGHKFPLAITVNDIIWLSNRATVISAGYQIF